MKKILIVGGVAGGASAAARLRRLNEEDKIIMFEKGPHVSFSNCSLPYHIGGLIPNEETLLLMNPEKFLKQFNVDARVNSEVVAIDRKNKEVTVVSEGREYKESYDKLILSMGAKPIVPPIKGIEKVNVFTVRNVVDISKIHNFLKGKANAKVSVIGGGFIGIEMAENLKKVGYDVTIVEALPQIMKPFDYDMVQILHREIMDNGVNLIVNDKVDSFDTNTVILGSGKKIEADAVILAIGVSPETDIAAKAGIELGKTKGIKVDSTYRTNDKDIYAVGDAIEVYSPLFNDYYRLPLAGPAQKQARAVADHINGRTVDNRGFISSSVIKVFGYNGASTGLSEGFIKAMNLNIEYDTVEIIPFDGVSIMPTARLMHFKLIYEVPTGKVLGAQAIGKGNVDKRIDVIATIIKFGGTIDDLKDLELCYAPSFGTAKDVVNFAGYVASNLRNGDYKQVHYSQVRELVEKDAYFLDVRMPEDFAVGHLEKAVNIPLGALRSRYNEIPKDRTVYITCKTGLTSYTACKILQNIGFNNVVNVSGGFIGLSQYEYFNDKTTGRKPILTGYFG
ncbi:pyridine nucleotide-disulfide oxidoreductase [Brachyspira hyodysenteriae]|uniref:FAD-dependent oxidoreductase n=1 Tax=Brachyspira hyodysenteriae TaxID=159 RepID=UPI001182EB6A|nr:FAD-dependent oxidoreductase [Brachyspira hyodysenteriae]TVL67114.1 pyridine nucleotide-disulfide oxidoreductase [Brachyspira hyodysenteriae]